MSRLAAKPIVLEDKITVEVLGESVRVKGPKGELMVPCQDQVEVRVEEKKVFVTCEDPSKKAFLGLTWALIRNAVMGVGSGFSKKLEVVGKGWRSTVKGNVIDLQVGYSHPVQFELPEGVTAVQENPGTFVLHSHDKQLLGQTAANIKSIRPVEPYKLKGIRITGQPLRQKVRKTAGK